MDRLKVNFIGIALVVGGLFAWFSSNFFYTLFWAFMDKWEFKEANLVAYTLANLTPFLLTVGAVTAAYFIVRHEINKQAARIGGGVSSYQQPVSSPPTIQPPRRPNMPLKAAVEYIVGTSQWLGSEEGVVTAMADFIESLPQQAVLENIRSWGRKGGIGKVQSPLIPIDASYWADHVFDLAEFYRSGSGVARHVFSSDYLPHDDFSDVHFDKDQIARLPRSEIKGAGVQPHPLNIEVGTDINFYEIAKDRPGIWSMMKLFKIRVENKERSRAISGIRVSITAVSAMTSGYRFPWILADNLQISAGDHEMIPFAKYEEWREPEKHPSPVDTIEIVVPQSDRFRLLGIEEEHILQVRCTGTGVPPADAAIRLSVVSGRLQIEKI